MDIAKILKPESVIPRLRATSKDEALRALADIAAPVTGKDSRAILGVLQAREALGTTGVGNGIALPHGRMPGLDRIHAFFARLDQPVPFEAMDDQPVDLIFVLLVPADAGTEHLKALARISRLLSDGRICEQIRKGGSADELREILTRPTATCAA